MFKTALYSSCSAFNSACLFFCSSKAVDTDMLTPTNTDKAPAIHVIGLASIVVLSSDIAVLANFIIAIKEVSATPNPIIPAVPDLFDSTNSPKLCMALVFNSSNFINVGSKLSVKATWVSLIAWLYCPCFPAKVSR